MKRIAWCMSIVLALAAVAPRSFADAYDAAMAEGVAAREKAVDTNDPSLWGEALRDFEKADAIRSTKESKYELANAAAHMKADDLAVEAYEAALSLGIEGTAKNKAKAFVAANAPKMARLTVLAPDGLRVDVDDHARGTTPLARPIVVFGGATVHVRVKDVDEAVTTKAGESKTIDLNPRFSTTTTAASATTTATTSTTATTPPPFDEKPPPVGDQGSSGGSGHGFAWAMIISGGVLVLAGAGTAIIASNKVSSARDALDGDCAVRDGDACPVAQAGKTQAAQNDVDDITTFKGVKIAGFVGLGVGVVAATIGVVSLLSSGSSSSASPTTSASWTPTFDLGARGATLGFKGAF